MKNVMSAKGTTNELRNPFRPTFGASPRFWAGRAYALEEYETAINAGPGHPFRSLVLSGTRGIGKTVLLSELEERASTQGWLVLRCPSTPGMVTRLVESLIPEALQKFRGRSERRKVTGFRVGGIGSISTDLDAEAEPTPTLASRMHQLADELSRFDSGFVISVDEVQDADPHDLHELATAYQDLVRDDKNVSLIVAGLTHGVDMLLDLPGTTFMRRAQRFELGPLTNEDSQLALLETARGSGLKMSFDAATRATIIAQGYPYLVQLVGSLSWDKARRDNAMEVSPHHVDAIASEAIYTIGLQVHQPSLKGVPDAQRNFLRAMADLMGEKTEPVNVTDVAKMLGKNTKGVSDTRSKLIDRELIAPAGWGQVDFVLPYFKEYLLTGQRTLKLR